MRYKSISRDYFVDMLHSYKNKEFWIKDLKCYNKEKNEFYIKESIKDIIEISDTLNFVYRDMTKFNQYTTKIKYEYVEGAYGSKNEKIMRVIKFFKEELKSASNYKEEIEKLMILAIWNENSEIYNLVKEIRKDEKGDMDNIELNHPLLKQVSSIKNEFLLKMKKEESAELKEKLEGKLMEKEEHPLKRQKI